MSNLFPAFAVPKAAEKNIQDKNRTKKSLYFDFEKGDFALENNGEIKTAEQKEFMILPLFGKQMM